MPKELVEQVYSHVSEEVDDDVPAVSAGKLVTSWCGVVLGDFMLEISTSYSLDRNDP